MEKHIGALTLTQYWLALTSLVPPRSLRFLRTHTTTNHFFAKGAATKFKCVVQHQNTLLSYWSAQKADSLKTGQFASQTNRKILLQYKNTKSVNKSSPVYDTKYRDFSAQGSFSTHNNSPLEIGRVPLQWFEEFHATLFSAQCYEADTKTLSCRCRLFLLFGQDLCTPIGQQRYQVIEKQKKSIGVSRRQEHDQERVLVSASYLSLNHHFSPRIIDQPLHNQRVRTRI